MPSNKKPTTHVTAATKVPPANFVFAQGVGGWVQAATLLAAHAAGPLGNTQYASGQALCTAVLGPCANLKVPLARGGFAQPNKRVCRWVRQLQRSNGAGVGRGNVYAGLTSKASMAALKANAAAKQASCAPVLASLQAKKVPGV